MLLEGILYNKHARVVNYNKDPDASHVYMDKSGKLFELTPGG